MKTESWPTAGAAIIANAMTMLDDVWSLVVCESGVRDRIVEQLGDELRFLVDDEALAAEVKNIETPQSAQALVVALKHFTRKDIVIVAGVEQMSDREIGLLDEDRNKLLGGPRLVLVTTDEGGHRFISAAPNIASWINGRCFRFDSNVGVMDVGSRLESLRMNFPAWSDSSVVGSARAGTLPPDPAFTEWLILLGKGSLLAG